MNDLVRAVRVRSLLVHTAGLLTELGARMALNHQTAHL